ncbi:excisionase [uncultured Oscillibacter sp.]|nr:excisionase [uncultured Oscillibacter sp.]
MAPICYDNNARCATREISNAGNCEFVLWVGSKRMIKRKQFDSYIARSYSI